MESQAVRLNEIDEGRAANCFARSLSETTAKGRYAVTLLAVCAVAFLGVTLVLVVAGRSLVWDTDGRLLYYPFMVGEGEWLRGVLSSALSGEISIPVYSFDIGFGADWLITASGNSNEPLNLLAALCPRELSEYLYGGLVFLRFYLAALTFSLYCFSRGRDKGSTLCGSLCYVLCGFVLFWGVLRHPNFIDFAVLLPLIFMGADRLFVRKNPLLLILSMAAFFVYSIYFAYMACIFLFFYCFVGYFSYPRRRSLKDFLFLAVKVIACLLASFLLVGFSTVPMFLTLASMGRVGVERDLALFQSGDFYASLGSVMLGNHTAQTAIVIGAVPVIALLALSICGRLLPKGDKRAWGSGIILCLVGLLLSVVGSMMNGFGYSTDRWALIFGFCAAYVVVLITPVLPQFGRKEWVRLCLLVATFALWGLFYGASAGTLLSYAVVVMLLVVFSALLIWASFRRKAMRQGLAEERQAFPRLLKTRALPVFLAVAVVLNATAYVGIFMSPLGSSYYKEFIRAGHVAGARDQLDLSDAVAVMDDSYRVDRPDTTYGRNGSYVHGYKGMDFYSSFYNQAVDDFRQSLGLADDVKSTMFDGVQQRRALEALLGARYYIASGEAERLVPECYERVMSLGEAHNGLTYSLFETDEVLPVAFVYDATVSQQEYDSLSLVERQEAMTKALVLAGGSDSNEPLQLETLDLPLGIDAQNGAIAQEGRIVVTEKGGSITFGMRGIPDAESYLCFEGLSYAPTSIAAADWMAEAPERSLLEYEDGWSSDGPPSAWITTSSALGGYSFEIVTSDSAKYAGKEDWAVNLGAAREPLDSVTVSFGAVGVYAFDELYACAQPLASVRENVAELQKGSTASIEFGINSFDIHVDAEQEVSGGGKEGDSRYVFVSIPYSSGWSATMDGNPIEIQKANIGFMAVEVDGAEHDVYFSYVTPGLLFGALCSGIGLVAIVAFELLWFRSGRRKRRSADKE